MTHPGDGAACFFVTALQADYFTDFQFDFDSGEQRAIATDVPSSSGLRKRTSLGAHPPYPHWQIDDRSRLDCFVGHA